MNPAAKVTKACWYFGRVSDTLPLWLLPLTACIAAGLTLFTGFGLNTVLLPVLLLFVPPAPAVWLASVVHLANNVFKLGLLGKHANLKTALWFGLPAVAAALVGALLLERLSAADTVLYSTMLWGRERPVHTVTAVLGVLILCFALLEMVPRLRALQFPARYLPVGGLLSGFFGGLSGHQGALRSAFLVRLGLAPAVYVATGVVISLCVDVGRMAVYLSSGQATKGLDIPMPLVAATLGAAFLGSFVGSRLIKKMTLTGLQHLVGVLLALLSLALLLGLV